MIWKLWGQGNLWSLVIWQNVSFDISGLYKKRKEKIFEKTFRYKLFLFVWEVFHYQNKYICKKVVTVYKSLNITYMQYSYIVQLFNQLNVEITPDYSRSRRSRSPVGAYSAGREHYGRHKHSQGHDRKPLADSYCYTGRDSDPGTWNFNIFSSKQYILSHYE